MKKLSLGLSFNDVLLIPQYSEVNSRADIDLSTWISKDVKLKIPLVTTKMDTVTGVDMAIAIGKLGGIGILPRFETPEQQAKKVAKVVKAGVKVAAAIGIKEGYLERASLLVKAGSKIINVDVAHGHMKRTIEATKNLRMMFKDEITIISGITSTYECAKDLYSAGADCLLVGVGVGATCTTRIQTGCGVPSITSLFETAKAAREYKKTFMPDAGMETSGDVVKALATGACAICSGFLFAGTKEAPGDIIELDGKRYKRYSGSASYEEKIKQKKLDESGKDENYTLHIEGVKGLVEYRGPIEMVVKKLLAGVRSGLSYCGARNIKELHKKAEFMQITQASYIENGVHGILVNLPKD